MANSIPALVPRGRGHQFVVYGDSCSGVPGGPHERTFASVNAVVRRLQPQPEFILFLGDEIVGLTADARALRAQWSHWLDVEMAWLDRSMTPVWHTTSNHTTYDVMSEAVFREVLRLPENGPPQQVRLSYFVRRNDLLLVFVHTSWSGLGGEGHVETEWLETVLKEHESARYKLVLGHHPIFPINGFSGAYQRELGSEYSRPFWDILVNAGVLAYLCSHILAFDVQANRGVLQICTAGAGTAHRMPEEVEYLHCVQAALDEKGLRCQVLDAAGVVRERVEWPLPIDAPFEWREVPHGGTEAVFSGHLTGGRIAELRLSGKTNTAAAAQTMFSAFSPDALAALWLGLRGPEQTLTGLCSVNTAAVQFTGWDLISLQPAASISISPFILIWGPAACSTATTATPDGHRSGVQPRPGWSDCAGRREWSIGHGQGGTKDRPYSGASLTVSIAIR